MVYNASNYLVSEKILNFFLSTRSPVFFSKFQTLPVEVLKIIESGIFCIRMLFLAINIITDLKWWAVSTYLIKYKFVNFSIRATNMAKTRKIMIL